MQALKRKCAMKIKKKKVTPVKKFFGGRKEFQKHPMKRM